MGFNHFVKESPNKYNNKQDEASGPKKKKNILTNKQTRWGEIVN